MSSTNGWGRSMKGIILNILSEMVINQQSMEEWNSILTESGRDGIYTSYSLYDDDEVFDLITYIARRRNISVEAFIFEFGRYMFPAFYTRYPELVNQFHDFLDLLESIDSVVHVEVNKMHPGAMTPVFEHKRLSAYQIELKYHSKRKLCRLALGLLDGAAEHFNQAYHLAHSPCLLEEGEYCGFLITLKN